MSKLPLVSVIIPAHNAGPWIRESVSSALTQTYEFVEVIVIDDGSTDDTTLVLAEFTDRRLRVESQSQRGAAAARNRGMAVSQGSLIQYLDADDTLSAEKIALQVDALMRTPAGFVASCAWAHLSDNRVREPHEKSVWRVTDPTEWLVVSLLGGGMMQPAGWLTPREIAEKAGIWNERLTLHDDGDYFARVLYNSAGNVFVENALVLYRERPGSLSRRRSRRDTESALAVCRSRQAVISARRNDEQARSAMATQYAQFAYEFGRSDPDLAAEAITTIRGLDAEPVNIVGGKAFRAAVALFGFTNAYSLRNRSRA